MQHNQNEMAERLMLPPLSSMVQPALRGLESSEDNWKGKTSPAERRKIQNRLNQRTWRQRRKLEKQLRQGAARKSSTDESDISTTSPSSALVLSSSSTWATSPDYTVIADARKHIHNEIGAFRKGSHCSSGRPSCAQTTPLMALAYIGRERQIMYIQEEDMDELYRVFLQRAQQNRRSPSPDPMADSLLPLLQFNLFRGLMDNMKMLGFTLSTACDDDSISPFGSNPSYNINTVFDIPSYLKPTETQLTVMHHPWLDLFPLPRLRDNLVNAGDDWDDEALCLDMIGQGGAPSGKGGIILWGEPWDPRNWELTEAFVKKWRWVFAGCEEMIRSSNYWRAKRGERPMCVRV